MAEALSSAPPNETSLLLSIDGDDASTEEKYQHRILNGSKNWCSERSLNRPFSWLAFFAIAVVASIILATTAFVYRSAPERYSKKQFHIFPSDFVWGTATSSYQIEGAVTEDGRGPSIWDVFSHAPGNTVNNGTGDIACDHYHRMEEDVALMKSLNVKAYRFSISWSRILPEGIGEQNPPGVQFYSRLIDMLLANDIEPWVTLFHWDLPQSLEDEYGGWLDIRTSEAFAEYARICFEQFGDRVKHWITLNESWTVSVAGYNNGVHAPGHKDKPTTEPYIVGHHMLLAHAKAANIYKQNFARKQKGMIGISNCGDFRYPLRADNDVDKQAAERAMLFQFGWFVDPILLGDYPEEMRKQLGDRLPHFTPQDQQDLLGSADFLGLNYYSALLATATKKKPTFGGYWADIFVDFSDDPSWEQNEMGWNVVPDGLRQMLLWISKRYDNPLIFITENGAAFHEPDLAAATHDENRRAYFEGHLRACAEAIEAGVNLAGYFAWSLLDNFEWQFSFTKRFGLCYVDVDTLERTPKLSGLWYRDTITDNGHNIAKDVSTLTSTGTRRNLVESSLPKLPERVLIGYGSDCDAVRRAVQDGVNVVIWAFMDIVSSEMLSPSKVFRPRVLQPALGQVVTNLDLPAIRDLIDELSRSGYDDVVHLVSFGGWDGPHLDPNLSADEWYSVWRRQVGGYFHGIDWDLEGNDRLESVNNYFTIDCLDKMGEISRMAKEDGYFVSVAPPQSYLDVHGTNRFSRYVNLTDEHRQWHSEFQYFGANVYAYLLAKYVHCIDLVSIQLYESFSRAGQAVHQGTQPGKYLEYYVDLLLVNDFNFFVDFADDSFVDLSGVNVTLPLSKLVFGLANGWVDTDSDRNLFISPQQVQIAWGALKAKDLLPRGFMFWTIDEEGTNGVNLAQGLNEVLHIRP